MRRTLLLAGTVLMAGLGTPDRPGAAEPVPLTLGPAELHSIAVRRSPQRGDPAEVADQVANESTAAEPALPAPTPEPAPDLVPEAKAVAGPPPLVHPAAPVISVVVLAPAELEAIGPRPRPAQPLEPSKEPTPLAAPWLATGSYPRPSRRPERAADAIEPVSAASGHAVAIVTVLAPPELQAIGPRARPNLQAAPSPQRRPTRLVFVPSRMAPPVLVPDEPAVVLDIREPIADQPAMQVDEGPATLDDAGLGTIGIRIGAAR